MGGKNPTIVLDDADLGLAVRLAVMGGFALIGQSCTATSRIIIEDGIADRFAAALAEAVAALRVGDGLTDGVQMGPAVSEEQLATDLEHVQIASDEGAELLAGGGRAGEGATSGSRRSSTASMCTAVSPRRRSSARSSASSERTTSTTHSSRPTPSGTASPQVWSPTTRAGR